MPPQIEGENSPSEPRVIDILKEETKWHYVCDAIEILTGGRDEKYSYEAAIALFVIKSWLSSTKSLLFAVKNAPTIFCSLILSEKIDEITEQEECSLPIRLTQTPPTCSLGHRDGHRHPRA